MIRMNIRLCRSALTVLAGVLVLTALVGCRGSTSPVPPVHLNRNMDQQNKFEAQEKTSLFYDGRAMRPIIEGTVSRGNLKADDHLHRGKIGAEFAKALPEADDDGAPFTKDEGFLARGKQRYQIYCVPCHDSSGNSRGIVVQRGMSPPPSLHDPRLRAMPLGQLYSVVTNGVGAMSSYKNQIKLRDRWAVAAYVRSLQESRGGAKTP